MSGHSQDALDLEERTAAKSIGAAVDGPTSSSAIASWSVVKSHATSALLDFTKMHVNRQAWKGLGEPRYRKTLIPRRSGAIQQSAKQGSSTPSYPKGKEARRVIEKAVKNSVVFRDLDAETHDRLIDAMFSLRVKAGETVIRQGDESTSSEFYVVQKGEFNVSKLNLGFDMLLTVVRPGQSFGELALLNNAPRAASVTATQDSVLWALRRDVFQDVVMSTAATRRAESEAVLSLVGSCC